MTEDDTRALGIDFENVLDDADFPIDRDELIDRYGDRELDLEDDDTTVETILSRINEESFESRQDLRQAILTAVGTDAVGRAGYSDRGAGELDSDESF